MNMRPMLALAAIAVLAITLGPAPGDPAPLPPLALHNADSAFPPEAIFFAAGQMQNVVKGVF
jgi:hypothetical protein